MKQPTLKEEFINKRIQQIEVSEDGTIIANNNMVFSLAKKETIGRFHPFFEGIIPLLDTLDTHVTFPSVNIEIASNAEQAFGLLDKRKYNLV